MRREGRRGGGGGAREALDERVEGVVGRASEAPVVQISRREVVRPGRRRRGVARGRASLPGRDDAGVSAGGFDARARFTPADVSLSRSRASLSAMRSRRCAICASSSSLVSLDVTSAGSSSSASLLAADPPEGAAEASALSGSAAARAPRRGAAESPREASRAPAVAPRLEPGREEARGGGGPGVDSPPNGRVGGASRPRAPDPGREPAREPGRDDAERDIARMTRGARTDAARTARATLRGRRRRRGRRALVMDDECAAGADLRDDDAGPVSPRLANRLRLKTREVGSDMRRGARSDLARAALAIDRAAPRGRSARSASRMGVAPRPFGRARAMLGVRRALASLWARRSRRRRKSSRSRRTPPRPPRRPLAGRGTRGPRPRPRRIRPRIPPRTPTGARSVTRRLTTLGGLRRRDAARGRGIVRGTLGRGERRRGSARRGGAHHRASAPRASAPGGRRERPPRSRPPRSSRSTSRRASPARRPPRPRPIGSRTSSFARPTPARSLPTGARGARAGVRHGGRGRRRAPGDPRGAARRGGAQTRRAGGGGEAQGEGEEDPEPERLQDGSPAQGDHGEGREGEETRSRRALRRRGHNGARDAPASGTLPSRAARRRKGGCVGGSRRRSRAARRRRDDDARGAPRIESAGEGGGEDKAREPEATDADAADKKAAARGPPRRTGSPPRALRIRPRTPRRSCPREKTTEPVEPAEGRRRPGGGLEASSDGERSRAPQDGLGGEAPAGLAEGAAGARAGKGGVGGEVGAGTVGGEARRRPTGVPTPPPPTPPDPCGFLLRLPFPATPLRAPPTRVQKR